MAGSFVRRSMVSTAALLLAIGLSGCMGGGGGADITPTSGSGGVSSGGGGGSTGGGSTGGNSGGGAPGGSGGATADEGFAVQVSGKADTDANGDPTRLGNLQTDGPRGITAQTTEDSNGNVQSVDVNYGNGAKTATFNNCNTTGHVTSCSASSGETLSATNEDFGTSGRVPSTYDYLRLGTWEKVPGNNATNAPLRVIYGVVGQKTVNMPATGSATYKGTAEMDVAENGSVSATNPVTLDANVDLTADFANKKVTGSLHSFEDGNGASVPGTVNLQQGTISGSTLSANLDGNINSENVTGSMKGMFYGPNADEVGGAFTLHSNSSPRKAVGVFAAKKQ